MCTYRHRNRYIYIYYHYLYNNKNICACMLVISTCVLGLDSFTSKSERPTKGLGRH